MSIHVDGAAIVVRHGRSYTNGTVSPPSCPRLKRASTSCFFVAKTRFRQSRHDRAVALLNCRRYLQKAGAREVERYAQWLRLDLDRAPLARRRPHTDDVGARHDVADGCPGRRRLVRAPAHEHWGECLRAAVGAHPLALCGRSSRPASRPERAALSAREGFPLCVSDRDCGDAGVGPADGLVGRRRGRGVRVRNSKPVRAHGPICTICCAAFTGSRRRSSSSASFCTSWPRSSILS